jgi:hypothetical protein
MAPDAGRDTLGIGLVTAVDQEGRPGAWGAGSIWLDVLRGSVVAAEMLGRAAGAILVEAGFSGRGGRLIRKVSRFGALGSGPGLAESAIIFYFYRYFGKKFNGEIRNRNVFMDLNGQLSSKNANNRPFSRAIHPPEQSRLF